MEKLFSCFLESCCKVVIVPLYEDNIRLLADRLKSDKEGLICAKKLVNIKKRCENLLATHESRAGFCSFLCFPFDNYVASTLLQNWEKLEEEEPNFGPLPQDSTGYPLSRTYTAPVGAIDADLNRYQSFGNVVRSGSDGDEGGDRHDTTDNFWGWNSLGFRGKSYQHERNLLSYNLTIAAGHGGTASVQNTHGIRLIRSKSFEILHEERRIVLDRRFLSREVN